MVLVPILGQSVDDSPAQTESPEGLGIVRREQSDKVSGLSAQTSVSREEADGNSQKELRASSADSIQAYLLSKVPQVDEWTKRLTCRYQNPVKSPAGLCISK